MLKPIFIWQNKVLKRINPDDVVLLSIDGNYTRIYLKNKKYYLVRSTLSGALKKLPADVFVKISRSVAVSVYHIDEISRDHLLIDDDSIPIAKQYYESLIDSLNIVK